MDLKVVGAGQLGVRLALLWKEKFPKSSVYLKTKHNDTERSLKWNKLGFKVLSSEQEDFVYGTPQRVQTPYIVFCAPPTNNPYYSADVDYCIKKDWEGADQGCFVFTSSGGVYSENNGGVVDENSQVESSCSARQEMLLKTEETVMENGGFVVRFAGLYTKQRGPHNYWLREGNEGKPNEFSSNPEGLINLIHYDDAAHLLMKVLLEHERSDERLFLASGGNPISRVGICRASLQCGAYKGRMLPTFTGGVGVVDGKRYCTDLVKKTFLWQPRFASFESFMKYHSDEEIDVSMFF